MPWSFFNQVYSVNVNSKGIGFHVALKLHKITTSAKLMRVRSASAFL